jgi:hypothetical protein
MATQVPQTDTQGHQIGTQAPHQQTDTPQVQQMGNQPPNQQTDTPQVQQMGIQALPHQQQGTQQAPAPAPKHGYPPMGYLLPHPGFYQPADPVSSWYAN